MEKCLCRRSTSGGSVGAGGATSDVFGLVSGVSIGVSVGDASDVPGDGDLCPKVKEMSSRRDVTGGDDDKSSSPAISPALSCSTPRKSGGFLSLRILTAGGCDSGPNLTNHSSLGGRPRFRGFCVVSGRMIGAAAS